MSESKKSAPPVLQTVVEVEMPLTYLHLNSGGQKPLLIFFHGYTDTAAAFLRRAWPADDPQYEILAPNGLFPTPVKIDGGWKQAFAWYFSDFSTKRVLISPAVSAKAVAELVEKLNLQDRPKVLIGFSQGGFFLPFVFPRLKNVKKMIAIGSAYRTEDYPEHFSIPLDAIHGEEDSVISLQHAQESFKQLAARNPKGNFYSFPGLGHSMNDQARALLKKLIQEAFASDF
jgi:predicted esterase